MRILIGNKEKQLVTKFALIQTKVLTQGDAEKFWYIRASETGKVWERLGVKFERGYNELAEEKKTLFH